MGAIQDKIKTLTFDPGANYLAQVADQQAQAIGDLQHRVTTLEQKVAACCDGAGLAATGPTADAIKALGDRVAVLEQRHTNPSSPPDVGTG